MRISVVTPLYMSAPYIVELHRRTVAAIELTGADSYELIFVNDGGPDDSLAIAQQVARQDSNVIVVDLSRNFGQHRAVLTGLEIASGDYVFVMDSDLEEQPEWISLFYVALREANVDVVFGIQTAKKKGYFYRLGRRVFYFALNSLSDHRFPENVVTARLMSRRYLAALSKFQEKEVDLAGLWHIAGFSQMPVHVKKLDESPSTYTLTKAAAIFVNAVTAFSTRPLVSISIAGIALSFVALAYTIWLIGRKLAWGTVVEGWTSVMAVNLIIGGVTLFFNGVIAIYIAKIFIEVKQRPRAIVRDIFRSQPKDARANET